MEKRERQEKGLIKATACSRGTPAAVSREALEGVLGKE